MAKRKTLPKVEAEVVFTNSINSVLTKKYRLKYKNVRQREFSELIREKEIIICAGPAGTGKSYISIATAIELLQDSPNSYNKIIIVKPAVEAEENLGFLPGDLKEKMAPYLASSIDIVDKILGKPKRVELENCELLVVEPLGFIRGKSIDNSILIMEEAQNMSPSQMKTLLTRIGYNSKYIISGDMDQSDKYDRVEQSGLYDAMGRHSKISEMGFFEFNENDIVRNPLITKILSNYEKINKDK
jgi:phosphate starvation-inducible protein PhoH and related proteins